MPDKSRRASYTKYRRKKAARQRLAERVAAGPQPAQPGATAQTTMTTTSEVQPSEAPHFVMANELRKIGILGGSLVVILIIVSIILHYAVTIT
jgi:hypothetical protein